MNLAQMKAEIARLNGTTTTTPSNNEPQLPLMARIEDKALRKTAEYLTARELLKARRQAEGYRF